jgi:hypothetical protein
METEKSTDASMRNPTARDFLVDDAPRYAQELCDLSDGQDVGPLPSHVD